MSLRKFLIIFSLLMSFSLWAQDLGIFQDYKVLSKADNEHTLPTILVLPAKLLPTQIAIGQQTVNALVKERFGEKVFSDLKLSWDKNFDLEKNLKTLKPEQLKAYVESIQSKMNKKPFDGAYMKAGIFHFDGHHRSRALYEVNTALSKISSDESLRVFIPVNLVQDYSRKEWSDKKIAKDIFITKAQGYVPLSVFQKTPKGTPEELALMKYFYLRKHAKDLGALIDDPYRSLIGQALFEENIDSDSFVTYFEFYLEELLKTEIDKALLPIVIKPGMEIRSDMVEKVKKILFTNPKRLKGIAYWARIDHLSKEEATKRCLKKEADICKKNRLLLEEVQQKFIQN